MLNRVKQVLAAITAKITTADQMFAAKYLAESEQKLFWQMNVPDQRHALNVAYTALKLSEAEEVDPNLLVRCSLLHDVGKSGGDISTFDKIITVIAHFLAPRWAYEWGRFGRGSKLDNIRHAFFIYFHHAERSAQILEAEGTTGILIDIVGRHHQLQLPEDPPELVLLRRADNEN